jgi:hypothetical protein
MDINTSVVCRLLNTRNNETDIYTGAVYTNIDGVYGYLCVDGLQAKFFWDNEGPVCCDHLLFFIVSYEIS